jgi:hypothetical protein
MSENTVVADSLGKRVDRLTALVKAQANRRPGLVRYALAAVVGTVLAAAGYEGYRHFHAEKAEVLPPAQAAAAVGKQATTSFPVASAKLTKSGLLLLNSKRDYRDADNLVVVLPAGHGLDAKGVVGKTVAVEGQVSTYNDRPQIKAEPGKWSLK